MHPSYNFDTVIDRRGTDSLKFDFGEEFGIPEDCLSLWVADMDFPTAPGVLAALKKDISFGIFGYGDAKGSYYDAVTGWYQKNFGWTTQKEWIVKTPGVVFALAQAVRAFTKPGDKILIQRPVYYPFTSVVVNNQRQLVNNPLILKDGRYEMDLTDLAEKLADPDVKMMILCSPHNPVGRVWTKEELTSVADLCLANGVLLISDEIHSDFVWGERKHFPLLSLDPKYEKNVIVCTAPSKTFNLAGLQNSNIFIPDPDLRAAFQKEIESSGFGEPSGPGLTACRAAYETGGEWLSALKDYIYGNITFARGYLAARLPQAGFIEPEGTYLIWLDFRAFGFTDKELNEKMVKEARLWLDAGSIFGPEGEGFERVNTACSRKYLEMALERMVKAFA